jgi:hypothetical protein
MTREERIAAIVNEVGVIGPDDNTGIADIDEPRQYLLVEKNHGRAAYAQSHFLTTHDSLDEAAAYHLGQEYREDWQIVFAVDLDTDARLTAVEPETLITWVTAGGESIGGNDCVSRESIIEALREAHRNDSAADAVEFVSDLVGWSAEDDEELAS